MSLVTGDQLILEEAFDDTNEPTDSEVVEYAAVIGIDPTRDSDIMWIAREGIRAALPPEWKPCQDTPTGNIYYFNFTTGDSSWDHPCDDYYKGLVESSRNKRLQGPTEQTSLPLSDLRGSLSPLKPPGGSGRSPKEDPLIAQARDILQPEEGGDSDSKEFQSKFQLDASIPELEGGNQGEEQSDDRDSGSQLEREKEEGSESWGCSELQERLNGLVEGLKDLVERFQELYPASLSPVRDISEGSDTQLAAVLLPSKIPVYSQSKRGPHVSPEILRLPEPTDELVPVRELELVRIRQQQEFYIELGRRKLRDMEIERERLTDESEQKIQTLKGDLFEREELVRREHEGKVEALKLELTERESEMREESRAVCSELNTDLDRMRTGNANKLTEMLESLSREIQERERVLAQEHAIKMREVERASQARKQELDREHNAELIALTEGLELEREEREFELREEISENMKQLRMKLESELERDSQAQINKLKTQYEEEREKLRSTLAADKQVYKQELNLELSEYKQELECVRESKQEIERERNELRDSKALLKTEKQQLETSKQQVETEKQKLDKDKQQLEVDKQQIETNKQQINREKEHLERDGQMFEEERIQIYSTREQTETEKENLLALLIDIEGERAQLDISKQEINTDSKARQERELREIEQEFAEALIERKRELLVQEETEIATFQYDLAVARLDKELLLQQQKEEIIMLRVEGEREQQALKTKRDIEALREERARSAAVATQTEIWRDDVMTSEVDTLQSYLLPGNRLDLCESPVLSLTDSLSSVLSRIRVAEGEFLLPDPVTMELEISLPDSSLSHGLAREESSLAGAKVFLEKQRLEVHNSKLRLKSATKEWKIEMHSILDPPSPGRLSLLQDIHNELQDEASQLNSEIRGLSIGHRLVSRKERVLREYSLSPMDSDRDTGRVMRSLLSINRQLDGVLSNLRSHCSHPLLSSRVSPGSIAALLPDFVPARQDWIDFLLKDKWLGYIRKTQIGTKTSLSSSTTIDQLSLQCDWLKKFPNRPLSPMSIMCQNLLPRAPGPLNTFELF